MCTEIRLEISAEKLRDLFGQRDTDSTCRREPSEAVDAHTPHNKLVTRHTRAEETSVSRVPGTVSTLHTYSISQYIIR